MWCYLFGFIPSSPSGCLYLLAYFDLLRTTTCSTVWLLLKAIRAQLRLLYNKSCCSDLSTPATEHGETAVMHRLCTNAVGTPGMTCMRQVYQARPVLVVQHLSNTWFAYDVILTSCVHISLITFSSPLLSCLHNVLWFLYHRNTLVPAQLDWRYGLFTGLSLYCSCLLRCCFWPGFGSLKRSSPPCECVRRRPAIPHQDFES